MTYQDPLLDPDIAADPFGYQAALFGGYAIPDEAPPQITGYIVDPDFDPAVHDGGDDDREDDAENRPFLPPVTGPAIVRPVAAQPEPAAETAAEAPAAPAADATALVPDLGLPVMPSTATNRDDVTAEELGFTDLRDRPLTYVWQTNEALLAAAGIEPTGDRDYNKLRNSVLTELARAADIEPRVWVSISRNENKYGTKSKAPKWVGYTRMKDVLEEGVKRGLIQEDRAEQHKSHFIGWTTPQGKIVIGRQSRYRATPKLIDAFRSVHSFHHIAGERVLRMKDADGLAVDAFRETDHVRRLAAPARAFNQMMRRHSLELVSDDAVCNRSRITLPVVRPDGTEGVQILCPTPTVELFRAFNRGSWRKGGRHYAWYQGLPKKYRRQLRIDGQAVVEVDLKALHPSMCYAMRGLAIPAECYDVPGVPEKVAKAATVVMIGSASRREAVEALLGKATDHKRPWLYDRAETKRILAAIEARHAPIKADFYADKAIDLMYIDSQMVAYVLAQCAKRDLPALPVHDSFICREADEAEVRALMVASWSKFLAGPCPRIEGGYLGVVVDNEDRSKSKDSSEYPLQIVSTSGPVALAPLGCPASPGPLVQDNLYPLVEDSPERVRTCETSRVLVETLDRRGAVPSQVSLGGASQDVPGAVRPVSVIANLKVIAGGLSNRVDLDEETSQASRLPGAVGVAASLKAERSPRRPRYGEVRPDRRPASKKASSAASLGYQPKMQRVAKPMKHVRRPAHVPLFGDLPVVLRPEVLVEAFRPAKAHRASTPVPAAALPPLGAQAPSPAPKPAPAPANRYRRPRPDPARWGVVG